MKSRTEFIQYIIDQRNPFYATKVATYFKSELGQYGAGDQFLGIRMPILRAIAKEFEFDFNEGDWGQLIQNEYHEIRMVTLLMMVYQFEEKKCTESDRLSIITFYINHLDYVNNWDLVDISASKLLGAYILLHPIEGERILWKLAKSKHLWRERVSIVSNYKLIRNGQFQLTLQLSEFFISHPHDLIHKACGWMLRELGKMDENTLVDFLDKYYTRLPRTMLRYSLEKLDVRARAHYMKKV